MITAIATLVVVLGFGDGASDWTPPDVAEWFTEEAPRVLGEFGETAPQDYRDELGVGRDGPVTVEVGEPILVHTWTREAVQGQTAPGERALESSDEWVAVGWVDGNPSSVITAYRNEAGEVAYAGITISPDTAEALT